MKFQKIILILVFALALSACGGGGGGEGDNSGGGIGNPDDPGIQPPAQSGETIINGKA